MGARAAQPAYGIDELFPTTLHAGQSARLTVYVDTAHGFTRPLYVQLLSNQGRFTHADTPWLRGHWNAIDFRHADEPIPGHERAAAVSYTPHRPGVALLAIRV